MNLNRYEGKESERHGLQSKELNHYSFHMIHITWFISNDSYQRIHFISVWKIFNLKSDRLFLCDSDLKAKIQRLVTDRNWWHSMVIRVYTGISAFDLFYSSWILRPFSMWEIAFLQLRIHFGCASNGFGQRIVYTIVLITTARWVLIWRSGGIRSSVKWLFTYMNFRLTERYNSTHCHRK